MLELVTSRAEKIASQRLLAELIRKLWRGQERRRIVWRPDSIDLDIAHEGQLWFAAHKAGADGGTLRYWNSFGAYERTGNLNIGIEINIPIETNDRRVSGFFARDPETGTVYLMHDGGVGGGREGVNREAFLNWTGLKPSPVSVEGERPRLGLIVAPLHGDAIDASLSGFVRRAMDFKAAVRAGDLAAMTGGEGPNYNDYFREFSGKKSGERRREFEYESRHGDIVDALATWASAGHNGCRIVKNAYIDLGVEVDGRLTHLFEVKTNTDRQCMYTGVGQLLVHGAGSPGLKRFLVVPDGECLAEDIARSLSELAIGVVRFALHGRSVSIRSAV